MLVQSDGAQPISIYLYCPPCKVHETWRYRITLLALLLLNFWHGSLTNSISVADGTWICGFQCVEYETWSIVPWVEKRHLKARVQAILLEIGISLGSGGWGERGGGDLAKGHEPKNSRIWLAAGGLPKTIPERHPNDTQSGLREAKGRFGSQYLKIIC